MAAKPSSPSSPAPKAKALSRKQQQKDGDATTKSSSPAATGAFSFEKKGRDWAISLTDLILAASAMFAAVHAAANAKTLMVQGLIGAKHIAEIAFSRYQLRPPEQRDPLLKFAFDVLKHVSGTIGVRIVQDESNLVAIAFNTLSLCAFLGFVRWGLMPHSRILNSVYGNMIEMTKWASIPFLIINLIDLTPILVASAHQWNQHVVPVGPAGLPTIPAAVLADKGANASMMNPSPLLIFVTLHLMFVINNFILRVSETFSDVASTLLTVVPLGILVFQTLYHPQMEDEDPTFRYAVVGGFIAVAVGKEVSGTPAFHVLLALVCWALEAARIGGAPKVANIFL